MPPPDADRQQFESFRTSMAALHEALPCLHAALCPDKDLEAESAWAAAMRRYEAFEQQGGEPVLVATLYGPTGAGKSTTFRLLTGVPVPAGDDIRPMTHACVAAVPAAFDEPGRLAAVFPSFDCQKLGDTGALLKRDENDSRLFYVPYPDRGGELPLILGDVPDFNSVETSNWAKAERLLERAEVVVFLVPDGSYANRDTVEQLARCCRLAAQLVYVFTKTDADRACRMWADLLERKLPDLRDGCDFRHTRWDGRTMLEFLKGSHAYAVPRDRIGLENFQPLNTGAPAFDSLLRGLEARKLILGGLLEPAVLLAQHGRELFSRCEDEQKQLDERLRDAEEDARRVAVRVAGGEYPIGRVIELILDEARSQQVWPVRFITRALGYVIYPVTQLKNGAIELKEKLFDKKDAAGKDRQDFEERRLDREIEDLLHRWRTAYPEERGDRGILSQAKIEQARQSFRGVPPPAPKSDWEKEVRLAVSRWCEENPILRNALPLMSNLFAVAGLGLIVADLAIAGGSLGTVGLVAAAGAGSLAAGKIVAWAERWKLESVVKVADERWRAQRTEEIEAHLRLQFVSAVYQDCYQRRETLKKLPVSRCRQAVDALESLSLHARKGERGA